MIIAGGVAAPVAVLAGGSGPGGPVVEGVAAPRPGESCSDATPEPGSSDVCQDTVPPDDPSGGFDLGLVLSILGVVVAGGFIALVAAFVILRRRPTAPLAPADPGEWWTCRSCGKTNVVGSPRCYACGTWQG
jgi:hypothetical protein